MPAIDPKRADGGEHPGKPGWPEGVEPVSLEDIGKLGIHRGTRQLHWNGAPVVTKHELGPRTYILAHLVAWATVASALIGAVALLHQVYVNLP
ncbi:hypothetical protein ACFWXH_13945 [Mesorhizobium sp. NPDC059054]|uniref:hypothetical protein n=1 Tax=Mesorhizobium sp. NPDC059054 TaxID=3346711 RepID=UPI00369EDEA7